MSGTSSPPNDITTAPETKSENESVKAKASAPSSGDEAMQDDVVEIEPGPGEPPPVPLNVTSNLPPKAWPPKTLGDLMTRKIISMQATEAIGDLESWMVRFRFHHLPVLSGTKLVGLITRTDFLHAALGMTPDGEAVEKVSVETRAEAIMRKNVVTGTPDAPLTTACQVMLREKLSCLPVILEDGTLVGIVTESDFMRLSLDLIDRLPK